MLKRGTLKLGKHNMLETTPWTMGTQCVPLDGNRHHQNHQQQHHTDNGNSRSSIAKQKIRPSNIKTPGQILCI